MYLHHRIARLYFSLFIYFIFLFIIIIITYLFTCFWFTTLDGLYPQAYDLISIFSIFMEVSNIWLKRIEYEKVLGQQNGGRSGNNLKPSSKFTRMKFLKKSHI